MTLSLTVIIIRSITVIMILIISSIICTIIHIDIVILIIIQFHSLWLWLVIDISLIWLDISKIYNLLQLYTYENEIGIYIKFDTYGYTHNS